MAVDIPEKHGFTKSCTCFGIRSCQLCKDPALREAYNMQPVRDELPECSAVYTLVDASGGTCTLRSDDGRTVSGDELPVPFTGLYFLEEVLEDGEKGEEALLAELEAWPWQPSQSGRWKKDFGPRANFKKRAVKVPTDWKGFPPLIRQTLDKIVSSCDVLEGFHAAESLALKYDHDRGANHALHIDDLWLWGERIIGVSLQSESVFTFYDQNNQIAVRIPLPRRSAYIISGRARFDWQHGLLSEDIVGPRIAITYRELTQELEETETGKIVLARAQCIASAPSITECTPDSNCNEEKESKK
eukprot:TRINITY_DN43023_c0_g1_i1.p1 TRINITY_DN43023_c0_g1~~TRINITY_DN43023_c0_g1_i1.p1  ORF type:complete len:308 (-),score=66.86 TRINITY_DN43023_c0_g1_i1:15-917(-)